MKYSQVYIDIGQEALNFIKNKFSLTDENKIYLTIIEKINNNSNVVTIDYIYEYILENGTKLDLNSIEEDIFVDVYVPIYDLDLAKFDQFKHFAEQGYDIYNKNSAFYKDFCTPANVDGNDISLKDRMKDIYPHNITFCKNNCIYSGINIEEKRVICSCNINSDKNMDEDNEYVEDDFKSYFLDNINYRLFLCYKLFFNSNNLKNSHAFYIILIIFFILLVFSFIHICYSLHRLKIYMARELFSIALDNKEIESKTIKDSQYLNINKYSNPKKKKETPFKDLKGINNKAKPTKNVFVVDLINKLSNDDIVSEETPKNKNLNNKKDEWIENVKVNEDNFALETKDKFAIGELKQKKEKNKIKIIKEEKTKEEDINELPFAIAIQIDNRNILSIFYSFIKEKMELRNIILNDNKLKAILFSEYILGLLINFFSMPYYTWMK